MAGDPILPPASRRFSDATQERRVAAATERSSPLPHPIAYPLFPFGGDAGPDDNWYIPVTAAAYAPQVAEPWIFQPDVLAHQGLILRIPWVTDVGTTGELRVDIHTFFVNPFSPSAAIALPDGSSGTAEFRWLHGIDPWDVDVAGAIQCIRTSGAGNVYVGYPLGGLISTGPEDCTETGV